jgi:serine/threonine protein kinase
MSDPSLPGIETHEAPRNEGPGGYIGPFKILQQIGEGGFGAVFEAEQDRPVKRRVALKVIKLGMDTHDVIARFEAERQALALMDHPHIARVLDAGATESGRPYFVMELVKGEPISSYCDKHALSIIERLKLFEQVCAAVQHAHTKGVIHRDLKPSNVLVSDQDGQPFAKVIDFGIAKAISGRLTDKTLFTELHQMVGTPLYMSPEQAEGSADIDTRTDIYSLGVLLYELLTGTTPFESDTLRTAAYAEVQRIIREVEPPRPSARLSESATTLSGVATARGTEPRRLTRLVRGELDWIVIKAIEKERARRYETANGLASDVRRYLAGQPVLAAPPSTLYRAKKFVRRHKGGVAASLLVAASLIVGIVGFAWQARIAKARAAELEQVSKFQADMLGQVDPTQAGILLSKDVKAKFEEALSKTGVAESDRSAQVEVFETQWQRVNATDAARDLIDSTILKPAVAAIDKQFKDQPVVDAALRQVLAVRYREMGLYDAAMPLQERALNTRRSVLGEEHPDTLTSINNMGELLAAHGHGKLSEAEPYYREALEKRRHLLGEEHPDTPSSALHPKNSRFRED